MFSNCSSLKILNLDFDISKITEMKSLFFGSLKSFNIWKHKKIAKKQLIANNAVKEDRRIHGISNNYNNIITF